MGLLLTSPYQPFTIAALVLVGLVLIEVATMLVGASLTEVVESATGGVQDGAGAGRAGPLDHGLDWLNVGRVPLMVLILIALAAFAISGLAVQAIASAVTAPLPALAASGIAAVASVPLIRAASRAVAWIMPRDETYAVGDEHFVGRTGVVTVGPVRAGVVARIKLQDQWGNWHFPRACPANPGDELPDGAAVLVVGRIGRELAVIRAQDAANKERASR